MNGADLWLDAVLDEGSFRSWDAPLPAPVDPEYRAALARATERAGADEAVRTGAGAVHGRSVAVIVSEFGFLGGSIGVVTADRIVAAFERARREGLPVIAGLASGGTRMQEGAAAFLTMRTITAAVREFRAAGLPYLSHLRHPTTGGVYASWASLAHDVSAEPHALVGLLGPRVVTALAACGGATPIPEGVQTAENLLSHERIDAVVDASGFRERAARLLGLFDTSATDDAIGSGSDLQDAPAIEPDADWAAVRAAAQPGRPALPELIATCDEFVPRRGGGGELVAGWARTGGTSFLLVGQDRTRGVPTTPADIATARRAMALAVSLGLPIVTVADTSGAELSRAAEEAGLAAEIAATLAAPGAQPVPSVALLLGEGTGAAAIALCGTDAIVAVQEAWLAPLPLAGAAALLSEDPGDPDDVRERIARRQRIGAPSLYADGLIDGIATDRGVSIARRLDGSRARGLAESVLALAVAVRARCAAVVG
ncbi:carboxyl transferase domain-containing protein [Microbacterium sp. ASV81]|uniref:Acetyl-coenzyme A carboxylase carboxyl transferase subunits beta/alpha n=1 Tax=Microbacterium capsulatum TaxID=3041921 RepID=A0ABU0XER8_9MICO|nr:carboxyl transferase domain-containing protein [Microbacterium sp. ASV81]MDQ4213608.1 carboxyl transferase domain-containing protein [Microbacterium sp. ASV81]